MVADQEQWRSPRHHGDLDAAPGLVDFAVNVRGLAPPRWLLDRLADRLPDLGRYPTVRDEKRARTAIAERHGRRADEVLPLAGAAEGFALLPALAPRRAAVIAPTFTEPGVMLRAAGVPVDDVVLPEPWTLAGLPRLADDVDLVVIGNPTNPTSVLHDRADILALRRPGRTIVVDEAFADSVLREPISLAGARHDDVLVLRSVTKTYALAGLRAGYLLGAPEVLERIGRRRPAWPVGTLALEALTACCERRGIAFARDNAEDVARQREHMIAALTSIGVEVLGEPAGPFLLVRVERGAELKDELARRGFAVRSCANFAGLGYDHLRLAVRDRVLVAKLVGAIRDARAEIARRGEKR